MSVIQLPCQLLVETFTHLRRCGAANRECQVLWVSAWSAPNRVSRVVHSRHEGHYAGFAVDGSWLTELWQDLRETRSRICVQVHTHPGPAFHSPTDDAWPILHVTGFLSLVIPDFARGPVTLTGSYLCELASNGNWAEREPNEWIEVS